MKYLDVALGLLLSTGAFANSSIVGEWTTACLTDDVPQHYNVALSFKNDGRYVSTVHFFTDSTCSTVRESAKGDGTYAVGSDYGQGKAIDFKDNENSYSYDIFAIQKESGSEQLRFGSATDSASSRPTQVTADLPVYYRTNN